MDFFATGAFQQLYSELAEPTSMLATGVDCYGLLPQAEVATPALDCCYADVNFGNGFEPGGMDYYGIITLDSNNNSITNVSNNNNSSSIDNNWSSNLSEQPELFFDFNEPPKLLASESTTSCAPPELSDWEQRLLEHFVEIPELIDILPERTPLCTDMCDDFLQESNNNLRLASPSLTAAAEDAASELPMQLSQNAAGEKGYLCTFGSCEKLYAKPAHLKAHLRRHMGEKPYACSWPDCSWRFSRSDELARHRRSHSGEKPFTCHYCAKCFARSDHLTKHRKVHERRLLAATRSGKLLPNGPLPQSVYAVRPGRKRKNQL